jgi:hypothetical protein
MTEPLWENGEPTNLEAAALDSLEWLRVAQRLLILRDEDRERLKRAIAALEKFLAAPVDEVMK